MRPGRGSRKPWEKGCLTEIYSTRSRTEQFYVGMLLVSSSALHDHVCSRPICRLANLALPGSPIKFKKSNMPFMQMENISHFLRACEAPPLNLPAHDRFLTVDLYESKDPAQVLQCLGAFSRVTHSLFPNKFRTTIGPKRGGALSPAATGPANGSSGLSGFGRSRGFSNTSSAVGNSAAIPSASRALSPSITGGSTSSRGTDGGAKSPNAPTSSWSKKTDEGITSPAWNIHQYGKHCAFILLDKILT